MSKIPGDDQILWFRRMWLEKLLIFLCVFDTSPKHRLQSHGSAKRFSLQEHSHLGFLQHVPAHLQKNDGQKGSAGAPQRLLYAYALIGLEIDIRLDLISNVCIIIPNPAAEKNVYTSRFWTGKPNSSNDHIYHFHVLELLNLDFFNRFLAVWVCICPYWVGN